MQFEIQGNPDYGELTVQLAPGEQVLTESGAMSRMSSRMDVKSRVPGGFLPGLARKFLSGESFFLGEYSAERGGWLSLSPSLPGTLLHRKLEGGGDSILLMARAFLACQPEITMRTRFGGFRSFFSGSGAFLLECSGAGDLFFNAYGAVVERELDGPLVVDTGHVVAFDPTLEYTIRGMGGAKQTLFSGEGLVMEFRGRGKVYLQTRTLGETAGWITPYLFG